ncbi:MAG TPA: site-specific integrase [Jiangellales bacterium]|nr:site-specific integrase [Jiangellales bacterium]
MSGKGRRAHGEGSVYEQRPGVWAAVVDLGWVDGKRRRKYVYADSERAAIAKRDELRRHVSLGVDLTAPPRTVAQWLEEWLRDIKSCDGTRASTLRRYGEVVRVQLVPGLGRVKLDKLTPRDVQRFLDRLRSQLAPASVVKVHGVLRVALSDAERLDLVPRNVAKAAKPPALARSERRALTPGEARALLSAVAEDRLGAVFVLALATGLRRGELLGQRWSDVDLAERVLFVRQTLQRVRGRLAVVDPKTHRSVRPVPLSGLAVRAFEEQRQRQEKERIAAGDLWESTALVFTSTVGTATEPRNLNRRFQELRRRAGLDWLRLHDLRHAFATFRPGRGAPDGDGPSRPFHHPFNRRYLRPRPGAPCAGSCGGD